MAEQNSACIHVMFTVKGWENENCFKYENWQMIVQTDFFVFNWKEKERKKEKLNKNPVLFTLCVCVCVRVCLFCLPEMLL